MTLTKRTLNLNFLQSLAQEQAPNVSQSLLALEDVVVDKIGAIKKRYGHSALGTRILGQEDSVTNIRYIADRQEELVVMSDAGVYKYGKTADKMIKVSPTILTEVEKTSIIRNVYNQSYAQSYLFNGNLVTIYQDSRGGYRYSVLDETSSTLIVNDVALGVINKGSFFEFNNKLYLFYVRNSDNNLCFRQFDSASFILFAEVAVENAVVTGTYRIKQYNSGALVIGYVITGDDLSIGYYGIDGSELSVRDAVPNKFTVTGTFGLFDFDVNEDAALVHRVIYMGGSNIKYATYNQLGAPVVATVTLTAYTNLHSATFNFDDNGIFIAWDKTATIAQEYMLYGLKINYAGTITTAAYTLGAGLSLVSEAFTVYGIRYVACCYTSVFQPNIFVLSEDGSVIAKFNKDAALQHRTSSELAIPVIDGEFIRIPLETRTRLSQEGDFYSQNYGISIFKLNYGYTTASHAVFNKTLYVSGSILRHYDGATFTEAGFLLRPDENVMTVLSSAAKASGFVSSTGKLTFTAYDYGTQGNSITVSFTTGATAGSEVVTVVGQAITVQIQSTVSTAAQIKTKLEASAAAMALISVVETTGGAMAAPATVTLSGGVGGSMLAGSYQYQACYSWTDNFGNVHRSGMSIPSTYVAVKNDSVAVKVPSLFVTEKSDVWIEVYRTEKDGTVFHLAGVVVNDQTSIYTTYTDTITDVLLAAKETAYTTGEVQNDSFQSCNCLTITDNRLILSGTESEDSVFFTKEYKPGIGLAPSNSFFINTNSKGGDIIAVRGFGDTVVVFKDKAIGIISGQFPVSSGLDISLKYSPVSDEYGCRSKRMLEIDKGLFFQSHRGLCAIDPNMTIAFIGAPVQDLTHDSVVTSMALLPDRQEIIITFQDSQAICFAYWCNMWSTFKNHAGYAAVAIGNDYYYLGLNDVILKKDETLFSDVGVPILMKFRSPWYQTGAIAGFQRLYNIAVQGKLEGAHGLLCKVYYDNEDAPREILKYEMNGLTTTISTISEFGPVLTGNLSKMNEQIRIQPRFQKNTAVSFEIEEYLPRGVEPNGSVTFYGCRLEIGTKSGSYRWDESKAMASLLSS